GSGFVGAGSGVHTFRYRQSSFSLAAPCTDASCAHAPAKLVAWSGVVHAVTGAGGRQRSVPTGGAAYGMPRNLRVLSSTKPTPSPLARWIAVPFWIFPAAAGHGADAS